MKSIQIILLLCININERFPETLLIRDIVVNINKLLKKELIEPSNTISGYQTTEKGRKVILALYKIFD